MKRSVVLLSAVAFVDLLLNSDANPNVATQAGLTPLIGAASQGQIEVVKLLLSKKADINAETVEGSTALMEAVWKENKECSRCSWMPVPTSASRRPTAIPHST